MTKAKSKVVITRYSICPFNTIKYWLDEWDIISKKKTLQYRNKVKITIQEVRGR